MPHQVGIDTVHGEGGVACRGEGVHRVARGAAGARGCGAPDAGGTRGSAQVADDNHSRTTCTTGKVVAPVVAATTAAAARVGHCTGAGRARPARAAAAQAAWARSDPGVSTAAAAACVVLCGARDVSEQSHPAVARDGRYAGVTHGACTAAAAAGVHVL